MLTMRVLCLALALIALVQGKTVPEPEPYHDDTNDEIYDSDEGGFSSSEEEDQRQINTRIDHVDDEIDRLTALLQTLQDELDKKVHDREEAQLRASNMKLRMAKKNRESNEGFYRCANLENQWVFDMPLSSTSVLCVCKEGFYRCADAEDQCVSDMLVCDGEPDCHDGSDESEHVCKDPLPVGARFEGRPLFDHCTHRKPHHMAFEVTESHAEDSFTSRKHMEARLYMEGDHDEEESISSLPLEGYYYFGKHYAIFDPPEDDGLGLFVEFDPGHDEILIASVHHEGDNIKCAEFDLHLVGGDDH